MATIETRNPMAQRHSRAGTWLVVLIAWGSQAVDCGEHSTLVLERIPDAVGGVSGASNYTPTGGNSSSTAGNSTSTVAGTSAAAGSVSSGPRGSAIGAPIGFAAIGGNGPTTGGGIQVPTLVKNCSDLTQWLELDDQPRVLLIDNVNIDCTRSPGDSVTTCPLPCAEATGDTKTVYRVLGTDNDCSTFGVSSSTQTVQKLRNETTVLVKSNKTILGKGGNAGVTGATLYLQAGVSNVIIQNLTFQGVNPDLVEAGDGITIDGAHHVWVDHCRFRHISDGFVDAVSTVGTILPANITLSWNHFDGNSESACAKQHNYANTIEHATITFHHNHWERTLGFSPKVTQPASKAHLFNNYWQSVLYYSVGVDKGAQALIESNVFDGSERPYWGLNACIEKGNCSIADRGGSNRFEGISAESTATHDTGGTLTDLPPYTIEPSQIEDPATSKQTVLAGAGPTLNP